MKRYLITKNHIMKTTMIYRTIIEYCIIKEEKEIVEYEKHFFKGLINRKVLEPMNLFKNVGHYKKLDISNNIYILMYKDDINILYILDDSEIDEEIENIISKSILIKDDKHLSHKILIQDKYVKAIFEGADFVGKSTLAEYCLNHYGWAVQDRDTDNVSFFIRDYISEDVQSKVINENIENNPNKLYIIMYTDKETISKRRKERKSYTEWDKIAEKSNEFYKNLKIEADNCIHLEINDYEDSHVTLLQTPYAGKVFKFTDKIRIW